MSGNVRLVRTDFGGGSLQSRLLGLVLRHSAKRVITAWSISPLLPWPYAVVDHVGRLQCKVPGSRFTPVVLPECRAEQVTTPSSGPDRHVLYFHGGAFLVGGRHLHRALISRISAATRATVLAVEYRKLPRHAVHVSVEDGLSAYRHLLAQGVAPSEIVFMGDSAGGFLTFTVAEAARSEGLPLPAAIVALSPLLDFDLVRSPLGTARFGCDVFNPRSIRNFSRLAHRIARGAGVPSPASCQLAGLPPVLIQVSSAETLFPQAVLHAARLEEAGVPVELQVWDGQVHVFQAARPLPEAREALVHIAAFVDEAMAAPGRTA